ncbi:MAG: hypothetical protein V3U59_05650 [Gammaproteobacteria bacterium]
MSEERYDELMRVAAELPREIEPSRDLWPGIEARIGQKAVTEPRSSGSWVRQFAAAASLVAISVLATLWVVKENQVPLNGWPVSSDFRIVHASVNQTFQEQIQVLPPESRIVVVKNLADIRASLEEIRRALREDPGNPMLQQLLVTVYQQELNYMSDISQMSQLVPGRNDI